MKDVPIDAVAARLREAAHVVALTGAGISTDSGIPDFRGPAGLWTTNPETERLFTLDNYMADRSVRVQAWRLRLEHPAWKAEPNAGHHALADLERRGHLHTLITQNVDGLHLAAGSSPRTLVEIHGTMREVVCMSCGTRLPMERVLERVSSGEEDPECRRCSGILKAATISFGQALDERDLLRAQHAAMSADLFVALGTSLQVYPVAYLPKLALDNGARLVIVNAQETPYDDVAETVIREPISEVFPEIVARVEG